MLSKVERQTGLCTYKIMADTVKTMCEGEIQQAMDEFDLAITEAAYLTRIGKKTADFISASYERGAVIASYSAKEAAALKQYGYALSMAFQITDDILDVTSSSVRLGKPAGNDLRQGILTLPGFY